MVQRDDTRGGSLSTAPSSSTSDQPPANSSTSASAGAGATFAAGGPPPEPHRSEPQRNAAQQVRDEVRTLASEAKEAAARQGHEVRHQVDQLVDRQKQQAAARLCSLAGALRQTASSLEDGEVAGLRRAADGAAERLDRFAGYLRDRNLSELVADVEGAARRHPDVFLGATFLSGLLLARLLKSSSERSRDDFGGYGAAGGWESGAYGSYETGSYGYGPAEARRGAERPGTSGDQAAGIGDRTAGVGDRATGVGSPVATYNELQDTLGSFNNPTYKTAVGPEGDLTTQRGGA
jgi:hypothetical protein